MEAVCSIEVSEVFELLQAVRTRQLYLDCRENLKNKTDYELSYIRNYALSDLYGRKTWLLTLGAEHSLRVFQNRVPKRVFGRMVK